jgi:hypothetical protein
MNASAAIADPLLLRVKRQYPYCSMLNVQLNIEN